MRCLLVTIMVVCAQGVWADEEEAASSDDQAAQEELADEPVVIGHLESRGYKITILAADDERLFTLRDRDGNLVAEQLSETELQARHPDIYEMLEESIAGEPIMMLFKDRSVEYAPVITTHEIRLLDE